MLYFPLSLTFANQVYRDRVIRSEINNHDSNENDDDMYNHLLAAKRDVIAEAVCACNLEAHTSDAYIEEKILPDETSPPSRTVVYSEV